ncbi:hypothetical protein IWW36_004124 [Coemansia brasiliensis]|uniref:Uncharacterized protein n=1 Tax=Coemansia brasiliensis TaxID=2650707 RepID=A0A9W8I3X3_9FUNG|nr:hypothetical protein IWW36_004124 [Coemansia brasiliensis]
MSNPSNFYLRKDDLQSAEKSPRRHGLGLRRARTATANSIKKLFKSKRDPQNAYSNGGTSSSNSGSSANNGRRRSLIPGLDALRSSSNDLEPVKAPAVQNLPIESRPSSAHSTRSMRTIFSSAKRITLRPSLLFRHQNHVADFGADAMALGDYVPASRISAPVVAASPTANAASAADTPRPLPSELQVRHEESMDLSSNMEADGAGTRKPSIAHSEHLPLSPLQQPLFLPRRSPIPTQILPSVPHTPPASLTGSDIVKSPTSYSSRSLGLSSLDFGYDEHIVSAIMPSSPGNSVSSESSPVQSLISAGSHLEPISLDANSADQGRDSPHRDIALDHMPCYEMGTLEEVVVPLTGADPIELIDVDKMNAVDEFSQKDEPSIPAEKATSERCSEYSVELVISAEIAGDHLPDKDAVCLSNSVLASSTIYELGSADKLSFLAMQKIQTSQPEISSPYVVQDIDELLEELGITDSLINGGNVTDKPIALDTPLPLNLDEDNDSFSLREIDELLQQLDKAAGFCSETPKVSSAVVSPVINVQRAISSMDAVNTMQTACETKKPKSYLDNTRTSMFNPWSIVASLGAPQKVVAASMGRPSVEANSFEPCSLLDPAALINSLGGVLDIQFPEQQETCIEQTVDVASLISSLGKVIALEEPEMQWLSVNELVSQLGDIEQICMAATKQPCSQILDVPNIISSLGGVYTPDFILCNVEQLRRTSTYTLVDEEAIVLDAACGQHSCEFPSLHLSSPKFYPSLLADSLLVNMSTMDVDESVMADSRSRTSSIISYNQPFEYFSGISRLMAALRIQPIVVSRPFLGPARRVLFPHLY